MAKDSNGGDDKAKKENGNDTAPSDSSASAEKKMPVQQTAPTTGHAIPPIPPGSMPQLAGAMLGITVGQPQQNPEVVQHICDYLSHDSDNRLQWYQSRGQKSHTFRMTALLVVAILAAIMLAIPLVALARGDMPFVKEFLDRYLTQIILVALALLGGGKLFDLLK
ncbi:MAG: hypothetical protein WD073_01580 [Xanthobacteraceae bacterium]